MELKKIISKLIQNSNDGLGLKSPILLNAKNGDGNCELIKKTAEENGYVYNEIITEYFNFTEMMELFHSTPFPTPLGNVVAPPFFKENNLYNFVINKWTKQEVISVIMRIMLNKIGVFTITCYDNSIEELGMGFQNRCILFDAEIA